MVKVTWTDQALNDLDSICLFVTVHGFKGSEVQRLYSHHLTQFCKRFVRENRPLPYSQKSGTWYLAMTWQSPHSLRGFRESNFSLFPNP